MISPRLTRQLNERREADAREQYDALTLATVGVLPATSTTATFVIPPTVVPNLHQAGERVVITSVIVSTTRFGFAENEENTGGRIEVRGLGRPATPNGEPNSRRPMGMFPLTPELAAPLLLAAMTRTPIIKAAQQ